MNAQTDDTRRSVLRRRNVVLKGRSFPLDMREGPDRSARDAYLDTLDVVRLWLARNDECIRCPRIITFSLIEDGVSFQVEAELVP